MAMVLCFGDSNTYGTPPIVVRGVSARFDPQTRWPRLMAVQVPGVDLVEEGLPGRTTMFDDPVMGAHMNGQMGLKIALESHGPIDLLIIMLGTNDVKARFTALPAQVQGGMSSLLDIAQHPLMQERHGRFQILVIAPPPVLEQGPIRHEFFGGAARSQPLAALYADLARARDVHFLDAGAHIAVSLVDGVHFDAPAHGVLAGAVADRVRAICA
jgi:lysophospholipase L1-like esterase